MPIEQKTQDELDAMKADMMEKHQAAVTAAFNYAGELPIGADRTRAFSFYDNLRIAPRVG